ncbi:glycerophosphodiester phosphodiesterase [Leucobacter viscericola]|uniref:glycerophosphodiester phosphodiesterase n=1 Tax=Leucobacter viscericola TaxID=2714935 RepID=A0A6G7XI34_9MICO|nr:glycerophosphodiester phosphodiesterase family protein [Leucobacter viscericola]QIK64274.1 glycerophosphodiester phosphodiesterase [Leucobacter viscericola]
MSALPASSTPPLVIGHRGAPGYRPEHTESAYRLAFELGADAVEPDIVATSDGVLVVRHENEISGTTDVADRPEFADRRTTKTVDGVRLTGWFTEDFTWEELATLRCRERLPKIRPENVTYDNTEPILRLCDVLSIADAQSEAQGTPLRIVIEIKHDHYFRELGLDLVELLLAELAATGWSERPEQLIIEAFELGALLRLREADVQAQLVFLAERIGSPADEVAAHEANRSHRARSYAWFRSNAGLDLLATVVDGISVAKWNILHLNALGRATGTTDLVQRAHDRGLHVYTWTLRPENRFLNLRFQGSVHGAEWGDWRGEFELVLASGVDGIFVDHPDIARMVRDESS